MKRTIKYVSIIAVAVVVIGGIAWAIARPPAIECIALENNTLENTFNEMGEVVPLTESDLYVKYGGKLLDVKTAEGSLVKEGDLLFVFDESDLKSQELGIFAEMSVLDSQIKGELQSLEIQKGSLETESAGLRIQAGQAQKDEEKSREDLESAQLIFEFGGVSSQDLKNAQTAYEHAVKNREMISGQLTNLASQITVINANISDLRRGQDTGDYSTDAGRQLLLAQKGALETKLSQLRENQSEVEIFAAQDGIVRDLTAKAGQVVPPGVKLCSVYQPNQFRVDSYILVENTDGVKLGDEVEITLRLRDGDKIFKGRVDQLAQDAADRVSKVGLNEKRIKVEIAPEAEGHKLVGPYWPVEVRFATAKAKNCLIAPKTALFEDGDNAWIVWAVRDGKAVKVAVERGVQTPSQVEIIGDLKPGDMIVKNVKTSKVSGGQSVRAVL